MAWDFAAQVHALTGFDADESTYTETGETFQVMVNQWLTDAAKEVINLLPPNLQKICTSEQSFTSVSVGSETESLNTGKVFNVFAGNYQAREISSSMKHKANDSDSLEYATSTDPVYYVESNKINVIPTSLNCKYEELQYPSVTYDSTSIGGTSLVVTSVVGEADDETFTLANHGFSDDDKVKLSNFSGDTALNGIVSVIESKTTNTFKLANVTIDTDATGGTVERIGSGFPDEAEYLVVLKAAIIALEYQMAMEEDMELYTPMVVNLKQDYLQGINALQLGKLVQPKTKKKDSDK